MTNHVQTAMTEAAYAQRVSARYYADARDKLLTNPERAFRSQTTAADWSARARTILTRELVRSAA